MKGFKRAAIAAVFALVFVLSLAIVGCSSSKYSLEAGTYTGTYKVHCSYDYAIPGSGPNAGTVTNYHGDHFGSIVTFEVDGRDSIWNVVNQAPEPDTASDDEEYHTYQKAGFGSDVFLTQFENWKPNEVMEIEVTVNEAGLPTDIKSDKRLTVPAGQTAQCGIVVLAMQIAIENGAGA